MSLEEESNENDYEEVQNRLGYEFEDRDRLIRAFTRAAYAKERVDRGIPCKDQAIYATLGDAVAKVALTDFLFPLLETSDDISKARADFEIEERQAEVAESLRIKSSIKLGGSEEERGAGEKDLADTLEALIGAIYLDGKNYENTKDIIIGWYREAGLLDEFES